MIIKVIPKVFIMLLITLQTGCAAAQYGASAIGGALTTKEFNEHDKRLDSIEEKLRQIESKP
jgi:hypothetical protein